MIHRKQSNFFRFEEDAFANKAEGSSKIYDEVILLKNVLQTEPQVKDLIIKYYDMYYTVIKNRKENQVEEIHEKIILKMFILNMIILFYLIILSELNLLKQY